MGFCGSVVIDIYTKGNEEEISATDSFQDQPKQTQLLSKLCNCPSGLHIHIWKVGFYISLV